MNNYIDPRPQQDISSFFWNFAVNLPLPYRSQEELQAHMQAVGEFLVRELPQSLNIWQEIGEFLECEYTQAFDREMRVGALPQIRNSVCVTGCLEGQHSSNCPLFPFDSHRPRSAVVPPPPPPPPPILRHVDTLHPADFIVGAEDEIPNLGFLV